MARATYPVRTLSVLAPPCMQAEQGAHGVPRDRRETQSTAGDALLAALRRREREALEELARRYSAELCRVAYLHVGDAGWAEDAAQETLLAAWDSARRTDERTPLRAWLLGILLNICRNELRSRSRRRRRDKAAGSARDTLIEHPADAGVRDSDALTRQTRLREALGQLDEGMREIVLLRYDRNLSIAECAQVLGIPEGTVKSRTHAALEKLRGLLGPEHL